MPKLAPMLVAVVALAAGCFELTDDDPFAYTRQPLFTGDWELEDVEGNETREFFVNDGSIVRFRVIVDGTPEGPWSITLTDPSNKQAVTIQEVGERHVRFTPGTWKVTVEAGEGSSGLVAVHVVRA